MIDTQTSYKTIVHPQSKTCPACGSPGLMDFFEIRQLPAHVCVLLDDANEARNAPKGDVALAFCRVCSLVHNRIFDPTKVSYKPGYEASLVHSKLFRKFMEGVASRLIDRYDLTNKTIVEIGCGSGYFLKLLCQDSGNYGIGIDPTVKKEGVEEVGKGRVRFIRDFFSQRYADLEVDFICCLSVFEHIPEPGDFLRRLRRMIGRRQIGVYFEVFNAFRAFRSHETWSIHYEQCNYFSRKSLLNIFELNGFNIKDTGTCYEGDQYLYVEAFPNGSTQCEITSKAQSQQQLPDDITSFASEHQKSMERWKDLLATMEREGRRVVVWGSGGKGISFLNELQTGDIISYVVDINPDRHGKYIPGSAQKIVAPDFLTEYRPDVVIITNPLYEQEIKSQVEQLGMNCEFYIA